MVKKKEKQESLTIKEAKALRKKIYLEKSKQSLINEIADYETVKEEFHIFWINFARTNKISEDLENIVFKHLKSIGYLTKEKFTDGMKHFGLI